jgi:hypothetical protein
MSCFLCQKDLHYDRLISRRRAVTGDLESRGLLGVTRWRSSAKGG